MNNLKKLFSIFITILIIFQLVLNVSAMNISTLDNGNIGDEVNQNEYMPEIILTNGPTFNIKGGAKNEIELNIKNPTPYVAKNIIVQPELVDVTDNPFSIYMADKDNKIDAISGQGDENITLIIEADQTTVNKTYTAKINYTFFNSYGKKFTSTSTIYLKTESAESPEFIIDNFKMNPQNILPGQAAEISFDIFNKGKLLMNDVYVKLTELDPQGISINNSSDTNYYKQISVGHTQNVVFNIIANNNMKSGSYPISINIKCKDIDGKEHSIEQKFFISVEDKEKEEEEKKSSIEIINITEPQGVYGVNQNVSVSFDLINNSEGTAKNIKVTATPAGEGAVVPKSANVKTIKELISGASTSMEFIFAPTALSKSQNYAIEFAVSYEDGTKKDEVNNVITFSQFVGINVTNPEGDKKDEPETGDKKKTSKPKIIVSNYESNPLIVMAGEEFDLTMTFLNSHSTKTVKNIKMFLTLAEEKAADEVKTGNIFTPVDSSNTFYFDIIPPKKTVDKKMRLYVVPDAQPKTYTLTVNFEYEDEEGNEYTATELLGINVKQPTQIETGEIYIPETAEVGVPVPLTFEVYNTGKVKLNNFMIKIEGDVDIPNKSTFIGNFESGNTEYFDSNFTPKSAGETPISVLLTYQDPSGESFEVRKDFILNVTESMNLPDDEFNSETMIPEDKPKNIKKIVIISIVSILIVVGCIFIFKKIKAKKNESFINDDID